MAQTERQRQLRYTIITICLPRAVDRFLRKNEDYGSGSDEFGAKAQIIDIARKYKKLKAHIWDGEPLTGEPLEEVIDDMIGHLLLLKEHIISQKWAQPLNVPTFSAEAWTDTYMAMVREHFNG